MYFTSNKKNTHAHTQKLYTIDMNKWSTEAATCERCSKLQLKLNGNYSSLREILAPSLRDHNGSLRAVNFSNGACATLREDEVLSFRALLLARCRREAVFELGFLYSQILGSLARSVVSQLLDFSACSVASRLLGSTQRSSYFASSLVPDGLQ